MVGKKLLIFKWEPSAPDGRYATTYVSRNGGAKVFKSKGGPCNC